MPRLPKMTPEKLAPAQADLYEAITGGVRFKSGPGIDMMESDGTLRGPFNAWLHIPETGQAAQQLGVKLRFESSLSGPARETAILTVARHWRSQYEWWAHEQIALKEGMTPEEIAAVKAGEGPDGNPELAAIRAFVAELMETGDVTDQTYETAHRHTGDKGMADLVTLAGYYAMISANLNVFRVAVPDGETPPFED
ncbi:carboxymuconolactone decarboxylase family protein [Nisaea acidiphila]|uniref:Carboxymuconolactone decarboxylase family protein n=1 Tax=Nisaea acidiphila TaxID=1862145 RepID=A0A9J7AWN2_9PROT|nr:carboxymuconolactone decarboxylase family protein [Nisaea acidiphila]UUX50660.1 carboxymuconolactone decarboxylase family protein [Nisaea acidiphila]